MHKVEYDQIKKDQTLIKENNNKLLTEQFLEDDIIEIPIVQMKEKNDSLIVDDSLEKKNINKPSKMNTATLEEINCQENMDTLTDGNVFLQK
jgi:hypothetical protein